VDFEAEVADTLRSLLDAVEGKVLLFKRQNLLLLRDAHLRAQARLHPCTQTR
jgi:hypothetical protein